AWQAAQTLQLILQVVGPGNRAHERALLVAFPVRFFSHNEFGSSPRSAAAATTAFRELCGLLHFQVTLDDLGGERHARVVLGRVLDLLEIIQAALLVD